MQISSLRIDRFGVWNDLSLDAFQDGLNVIYGPNGSGKTTVVQFLRAMLYGFTDDVRTRYLPSDTRDAGGILTVIGETGRRAVHRYDDSRHLERLVVKRDDDSVVTEQDLRDLTDGVPPDTFDHVFSISFLPGPEIQDLVEVAIGRGFDVLGGDGDLLQLRELREQLQSKRRALRDLSRCDIPLQSLRSQRRTLEREIESLTVSLRRQQDDWDQRISGSASLIHDLEQQLAALQQELTEAEAAWESRQSQRLRMEQSLQETRLRRERDSLQWRSRLAEIETLRDRWQATLNEVAQRRRYLGLERGHDPGADLEPNGAVGNDGWCQHHVWAEPGQLHECEEQLRLAIAGLMREHAELTARLSGLTAVRLDDGAHEHCCQCQCHQEPMGSLSDYDESQLAALDKELKPLDQRRREIMADIDTVRGELTEVRRRSEQWKHEREQAESHRLRDLRQQLECIDRDLNGLEERRQFEAAIAAIEKEIQLVEQSVREPAVLREASEFLRRLTACRLQQISITRKHEVRVRNGAGERLDCQQLSRGNRDQVYLALCLALIRAYARDGIRFPLILNDAFINIDAEGAKAAAVLLQEFVGQGQQVLLFTRHQHVADLYRAMKVPVRELPRYGKKADEPPVKAVETDDALESKRLEVNHQLQVIAQENQEAEEPERYHSWSSEEFPGELTDRVRLDASVDTATTGKSTQVSEYFLHETHPIQDAPSIDAATAERFRKIGVLIVGHLLRLNADDAAERLRYTGITAAMIRRWQAEALLVCRVPRLRPYDARILVACGITSPRELAEMDTDSLGQRVADFATTTTGQVLLQSGNRYEVARLIDWIQAARKLRGDQAETLHPLTPASFGSHEGRPYTGGSSRRRRYGAARTQRDLDAADGSVDTPATENSADVVKMQQTGPQLRFYLSLEDPLVDAPSIGPQTAQRFDKIGIHTVAQFLRANPKLAAERLDHRRIDAATIRTWQQQTTLACQIPMVRGHDAQILVACGVTDPETLANMDASELWAKVEPFCETSEGRRIIRSGKAPDFEEVYHWIQWAGHARALKAA